MTKEVLPIVVVGVGYYHYEPRDFYMFDVFQAIAVCFFLLATLLSHSWEMRALSDWLLCHFNVITMIFDSFLAFRLDKML